MSRTFFVLIGASLLLGGCFGKFKREAHTIDDVRADIYTLTYPDVQLGFLWGDDPVSVVVNTAQTAAGIALERRLAQAVNPGQVGLALQDGLSDGLGGGPPFVFSGQPNADGLVHIEVESWGLSVPHLGAPGQLYYNLKASVYKASGERIYTQRTSCTNAFGAPNEVMMAIGAVNNVLELERMTDEEVQAAFEIVAHWCGVEVARKMRQHAG